MDEAAILGEEDESDDLDLTPDVDEAEQADLLGDIPQGKRKAKKARKNSSSIVANMLIGIGNTPYVRGTGGGLSPDKGVPMEFLEIGKWQWKANSNDEVINVTVYKNDEIAAEEGSIEIEAGQRREIAIHFPAE